MSKPQNVHCRLCADLKPYDELVDLGAEKEKKIRVLEKLSRLNVQVTSLSLQSTEDVLPKTVCEPCMDSLCKAYHFVLDVETAQEALKVHLLVQNIKKDLDNNDLCDEYKYNPRDIKVESDSNTLTERIAEDAENGLNLSENKLKNDEDISSKGLSSQNVPDLHTNGPNLIIKDEERNTNELRTDLEPNPSENDAETTNSDEFEVDSKEDATEIELKSRLEEDVHANVFKKDFEVTVTGYQMEIISKLSLNKPTIDVKSNENSINDRDELFIDTDSHNTINIDDNEAQNSPNVNNEIMSSSEHDSINFQTRKRKLNDYSKSQQEIISNVVAPNSRPLQYLNKNLSDNLKTNKAIVVLNKISIHNGNNNTLIISPLRVNESEFGRKVRGRDVGIDLNKKSTDNKQLNINEEKNPTKNEQHLVHDKSLTQLEFSWKQYIWQCGDCNKNFDRVQKLIVHSKLIHSSCGNYKCTDCYYSTSELYSFISHVKIHREYLSLSCYKCYRSFDSPNFLQSHYDRFMKSNNLCSGCLDKFETNQELAKHKEMYAKEKSTISEQYEREVWRENEVEMKGLEEKQYICDRCGKLFIYKHFLIYHIKIHHKL